MKNINFDNVIIVFERVQSFNTLTKSQEIVLKDMFFIQITCTQSSQNNHLDIILIINRFDKKTDNFEKRCDFGGKDNIFFS